MKEVLIYTLADPDTKAIRYVGKTITSLKQRLASHLILNRYNDYRRNWIKSLVDQGKKPEIEIIDIVPKEEWEFWEDFWIQQCKSWGFRLTNLQRGGGGPSTEFIEKRRQQKYNRPRRYIGEPSFKIESII